MKTASLTSLTAAVLLASPADAFWRMLCKRTGYARIDPIVNFGEISSHAHAIHGGGNFGMDTTFEDLRDSDCSSCMVPEDKSAYWTPGLVFVYKNGTAEPVPQAAHMLAYYLLEGKNIKAFPDGFQMIAGDNRLRNFTGVVPDPPKSSWGEKDKTQHALAQKAVGMNCMNYAPGKNEPTAYRHFLPDKAYLDANCPNGLRAELFFPSCWNGKTTSEDHKSHVAYPDMVNTGNCPKGYDQRLPTLLFETIWFTQNFNGKDGQFVWSNGDPTGFGYHGDFQNGWDNKFLQSAVDQCTNMSGNLQDCPIFAPTLVQEDKIKKCEFKEPQQLKDDSCNKPAKGICGNVDIQYGPEMASSLTPGKSEPPTAKPTIASPPASQVPTLSFSEAKSQTTAGVTVANTKASSSAPSSSSSKAAPAAASSSSKSSKSSAGYTPIAPPKPSKAGEADVGVKKESDVLDAPAPTNAPAVPAEEPKAKIVGTSTYTSAGAIYHMVMEEVEVTVTAGSPAASAKSNVRRHEHAHAHMHHKRDREHGLLRQH
ncbi:unnamed protein product [Periconia digitata]|uniref:DUF1996 domain-containing protein n=1 Tax=Periconia digitata TaxID=1303443 RepID=A0A9W4U8S0_9PLEO|nr:unnamed protein product [Periconia digitata]